MERRSLAFLEPVDPATVWQNERADFVPWLVVPDNLRRLGDALGLDLEPLTREAPVGRFRADLVCRDRGTGGAVVIEAQLGSSDHRHLGQILTYAEGLEADVVIWLGTRFHDEHRAVLGRLNRSSDFRCFAVAVDLWKIDASRTAPQFTVLAAPRDWSGPAAGTPGHRPAEAVGAPAAAAAGISPIRIRRKRRGMSLRQLADAAGLSTACVAQIETGKSRGTPKTRAAIERALDMPPGAPDGCGRHLPTLSPSDEPAPPASGRGEGKEVSAGGSSPHRKEGSG